ncbi:sulfate adenylyltransferase subunit 1 [Spirochaetota bacterium]|nr:sulfate adenylyltransferase subunit 1 [Spirochaetota bacterium]
MTNAPPALWKNAKNKVTFNTFLQNHSFIKNNTPAIVNTFLNNVMNPFSKINLLRLVTAGSVDNGKSTLIGRLLYDSKALYLDQKDILIKENSFTAQNLAYITDGLKAEREQGITIDVAYRYFYHKERRFILADTPGHIEYTKNMITATSTADLMLLIIDATQPLTEQSKRHAIISSILNVPHIIVCVNKMDLVAYKESVFYDIQTQLQAFLKNLSFTTIDYIPISAINGDNVVTQSTRMLWYKSPPLRDQLTKIKIINDTSPHGRFPIQHVIHFNPKTTSKNTLAPHMALLKDKPTSPKNTPIRRYAGQVASGVFKPKQKVTVYPSRMTTTITKIFVAEKEVPAAIYPMSIAVELSDNIAAERGTLLIPEHDHPPTVTSTLTAYLCSLHTEPLHPQTPYLLKHGCKVVKAKIEQVISKLNIHTFAAEPPSKTLLPNDIATVKIQVSKPLFIDAYRENRHNGNFILIDPNTFATIAAGMCQ